MPSATVAAGPERDPAAADAELATTAAAAQSASRSAFWVLSVVGLALCVPAWLLPWFVELTSNGIGFSPQDVVSSSPTGIGTVLVYVVGIALLGLLVGFVYDAGAVALGHRDPVSNHLQQLKRGAIGAGLFGFGVITGILFGTNLISTGTVVVGAVLLLSLLVDAGIIVFQGRTPFRFMRVRGYLALAGVAATFLIWLLIGVYREEPLFGTLKDNALTDNAVWMMLTGMAVLTLAFLEGHRVISLLGGMVASGLAVAGVFTPWFRTDGAIGRQPVYHSLLDAFSSASGIALVLLALTLGCVVVTVAAFVVDVVVSATGRRVVQPFAWQRGAVALTGASASVALTCATVQSRDPSFGAGFRTLDSRYGILLAGLLVAAIVLFLGDRITVNRTVALGVAAFTIGGLFPLIFTQSTGFILWGASAAAIYVLLSLGLNVVVGFAGLLDLGYAAFFAIGAYTAGSLNSSRHGIFLPFWVVIFMGAAVAALFGAILGAPTLRLRGDYLAIVTLGFGEIVPDMANNNFLSQTGGPNGITGIHQPTIGAYSFGLDKKPFFWAILIVVALVMLALRNLERSRLGRAWMAIREDEIAAAATGVNTVTTKLLAFSIGATVSGIAGTFFGALLGIVTPGDFDFAVSVTALSTVVLGGIGNNSGAALGGILMSFIVFWVLPHMQEWAQTFGTTTGISSLATVDYNNYKYIVYGVILMSVMLLRPGGLLPSRARRIELQSGTEPEALATMEAA